MKRISFGACLGATAFAVSGIMFTSSASAAAAHPDPAGHVIDLGPSPGGLPASCPFSNNDASFLVVGGNVVVHESSNSNGDWGGLTFEGTAVFQEAPYSGFDPNGNPIDTGLPVQLYEGHLSYWSGGGNNSGGQSEGGLSVDFHGNALSGTGSLVLHVNGHGTTNDAGIPTASVVNVNAYCS